MEWKKPENINQACIKEYKIEIYKECPKFNELCQCQKEIFQYTTNETKFEFAVLIPYTNYSMKIATRKRTSLVYGNFTEVQFESKSSRYSHNPEILKVIQPQLLKSNHTKSGSFIMDFDYPCPLIGETTFFERIKAVRKSALMTVPSNRIATKSFEISSLENGQKYEMWIDACDGHGGMCFKSVSQVVKIKCELRCSDGSCFKFSERCNYFYECPNGSDEFHCPCDPPDYFRCRNDYCIRNSSRCDSFHDCSDKSDEEECPRCGDNKFLCNTGECIPITKLCNGISDCFDSSDEVDCSYWKDM